MSLVKLPPEEQHFVISDLDWDTYVTFSDRLKKFNARCNYDGVNLELMTVSSEHNRASLVLGALIWELFISMDTVHNVVMSPSFIYRRQDLNLGFETEVRRCAKITCPFGGAISADEFHSSIRHETAVF